MAPGKIKFSFGNYMQAFALWTMQNCVAARAAALARAGDPPIAWATSASVKASQKIQIQFLKLHVGF